MRFCAIMAAVVTGGQAMACMPEILPASNVPTRGPECSISYQIGGATAVGLGQAQDLGQGYVLQSAFSGTGCSGETHMVVMDCNKGQSVVLGPYTWAVMEYTAPPTKLERLTTAIATSVKKPGTDVLQAAEDKARSLGMTEALKLRGNARIVVEGRVLGLACACKTFYPGLKPKS